MAAGVKSSARVKARTGSYMGSSTVFGSANAAGESTIAQASGDAASTSGGSANNVVRAVSTGRGAVTYADAASVAADAGLANNFATSTARNNSAGNWVWVNG